MFATPDLAARIDRAESRLCASIADAIRRHSPGLRSAVYEIGGGKAVFAGPHSPTNKMIGVGFDGVPGDNELERVEREFADRDAPLQAEVSTLADPELHGRLARRGYEPRGFENVLGHPLAGAPPGDAAIRIERVQPDGLPMLMEILVTAFTTPDIGGVGGDELPPADAMRDALLRTMSVPGFEGFAARIDGDVVGAAVFRIDGDVAQFSGAGTLPRFRRRGVQTALLRARLRRAREAACAVAVVVTQPASKSQQNVQREGFALLYARQLLIKPARRDSHASSRERSD
jgi:GNAT superfamily N-acetyltransferase